MPEGPCATLCWQRGARGTWGSLSHLGRWTSPEWWDGWQDSSQSGPKGAVPGAVQPGGSPWGPGMHRAGRQTLAGLCRPL